MPDLLSHGSTTPPHQAICPVRRLSGERAAESCFFHYAYGNNWHKPHAVQSANIAASLVHNRSLKCGAAADVNSRMVIRLQNRMTDIPSALDAVDAFFNSLCHDGPARFDVALALEELLSNVIRHGCPPGETCAIGVTLRRAADALTLTLVDGGRAFDPLSLPPPDTAAPAEVRALGGIGVHLVRQIMQDIRYRRLCGMNVLRMTRRLDGPAP